MACKNQPSEKKRRNCREDASFHDQRLLGADGAEVKVAASFTGAEEGDKSLAEENESFKSEYRAAGVTAACRVVFFDSPHACRVALAKYGTSVDSALASALKLVGEIISTDVGRLNPNILTATFPTSFLSAMEDVFTLWITILLPFSPPLLQQSFYSPLNLSLKKGDAATARSLVVTGIYAKSSNLLDDANGDECRDLLEHHGIVLAALDDDPNLIISAALEHCVALSNEQKASVPAKELPLRPYHFDPSFLWANPDARAAIFKWARSAFVVQQAAAISLFANLPDDCACDVLDFLQVPMPRSESLHVATCCASPEAQAWMRAVVVAAVLVRIFAS